MSGPYAYYNSCMSIIQTIVTSGCTILATVIGLAVQTATKMLENRQAEKREQRENLISRTEKYISLCADVYKGSNRLIEVYRKFPPMGVILTEEEAADVRELVENEEEVVRGIDNAKGLATQSMVVLTAERQELKEPLTKLMEDADFVQTLGISNESDIPDNLVEEADIRYQSAVAEVADALGKSIN